MTAPERQPSEREIAIAKQILEASGYVALKAKSYRNSQERRRMAEARAEYEAQANLGTQRWVQQDLVPEIRSLHDRVTFLYGAARAAGASVEDLQGKP